MCEWKGAATYHNLTLKSTNDTVKSKIWSYSSPTPRFKDIKSYLCFYASGVPWSCYVDGEQVNPQEGYVCSVDSPELTSLDLSTADGLQGMLFAPL